jgi:hypothetical protein
VTFFSLDNQKRTYDDHKRLRSVDYADKGTAGNYVDPLVDVHKDWRDDYHYDEKGRLTGWTRTRGKDKQEFTADGALVLTKDAKGQPLKTRSVRYLLKPRPNQPPLLTTD